MALVEPHGFRDGRSGALCCSGDDDAPAAFLRHQDDVAAVLHRANSAYFGAKGAHGPEAVARLHLVAVEPAFWGQGIGSRLVEGAVAKARSGGYRALLSEMAGTASLRVGESGDVQGRAHGHRCRGQRSLTARSQRRSLVFGRRRGPRCRGQARTACCSSRSSSKQGASIHPFLPTSHCQCQS